MANATQGEFSVADWNTWGPRNLVLWWVAVVVGQEGMAVVIEAVAALSRKRIPESGKFLVEFGWKDWLCVYVNRLSVPIMTYHLLRFAWFAEGHIEWDLDKMTPLNTLGSMAAWFLVYDMFYVPFHAALHMRGVYKYIHKHHHSNAAPARGNLDASNTHPIEFVLGEYIHLLVAFLVPGHVVGLLAFVLTGGVLASLNHTRLDVEIPFLYTVRAHDKHHHMPQTNYGQYTMFLDKLLGTFQEHTKAGQEKAQ